MEKLLLKSPEDITKISGHTVLIGSGFVCKRYPTHLPFFLKEENGIKSAFPIFDPVETSMDFGMADNCSLLTKKISAGANVVFSISLKTPHALYLLLDIMSMIDRYLDCEIPIMVGVLNGKGREFKYLRDDEVLMWTCFRDYRWDVYQKFLDENVFSFVDGRYAGHAAIPMIKNSVIKEIEKVLAAKGACEILLNIEKLVKKSSEEAYAKYNKLNACLFPDAYLKIQDKFFERSKGCYRNSSTDMRSSLMAHGSFKDEEGLSLLDTEMNSGWPISFKLDCGEGAIYVVPDTVEHEDFLRHIRRIPETKYELQTSPGSGESPFEISLESPIKREMEEGSEITLKVKPPGGKKVSSHIATVRCFIEFLVIYLASQGEGGIALIPGSLKDKVELIKKLKKARKQIVMMYDSGNKQLNPLLGGEMFLGYTSNVDTHIQRVINKILFNKRKPEGVDALQTIARGRTPGGQRATHEGYSIEKIRNVRLIFAEKEIDSLKRFQFILPVDAEEDRAFRPLLEFNKYAKKFFNALAVMLERENSLITKK